MPAPRDQFDVIVIGGGHAGTEAADAAGRLGARVALVTLDPIKTGAMSCNPAVGGLAKGQIVREIDALGGLMGRAIDAAGIQFRLLNRSKGPAVHGPRGQADKHRYAQAVQDLLSRNRNVRTVVGEAASLPTAEDGRRVTGVTLADGRTLHASAVVVTTGTFLRGLMHTGERQTPGGRVGEGFARGLSRSLTSLGLELGRLKTGTPPRLDRRTIDFSAFEEQAGDDSPRPFSFLHEYDVGDAWRPPLPQVSCWVGQTTPGAHDLIRANLHRAPMFSGQIASVGPRYCPSVEDKIHRFADKPSHTLFLEPETLDGDEVYVNGLSTSLPQDVQAGVLAAIPGLDRSAVLRWGYAVEYDVVWPHQIDRTLMTKRVAGLFLAGQINGTSGYEEAAGQGLIAGVNAARFAASPVDFEPFVLRRDQAYVGVLIDDLVTKNPIEPYRMFTSRAEHRLHLRSDNADERLTPLARDAGLVDAARWDGFSKSDQAVESAMALAKSTRIDGLRVEAWLRRPEASWAALSDRLPPFAVIDGLAARRVEIRCTYAGYLDRQSRQIEHAATLETKPIPCDMDYARVVGLRTEARVTLERFTPRSLGQASRLSGVTPADVSLLAIHLRRSSADAPATG